MKKLLLKGIARTAYGGFLSLIVSAYTYAQPVISSFTPEHGTVGSSVTISGMSFNPRADQNVVFFGATQAVVQSVEGSTTLTVTVPVGADYKYLSVTDLSNSLTGYSTLPFVVTYSPMGDNSFRPMFTFVTGSSGSAYYITVADMNRDGKPDLVTANDEGTLSVLLNQTGSSTVTASFSSPILIGTAVVNSAVNLAIGDFDGDGWPDLAESYSGITTLLVYRNTTVVQGATPSFDLAFTSTINNPASAIASGDLDADGKPDLVVVAATASSPDNVSVLRNVSVSGTISFDAPIIFAAGTHPSAVLIADVDRDTQPDVLVLDTSINSDLYVFHNASTVGSISLSVGSVISPLGNPLNSPHAMALGDLDGDDLLDLVIVNPSSNALSILQNTCSSTGTASFASPYDLNTGASSADQVAIADLDGDGKPDLVSASVFTLSMGVYRNLSTVGNFLFTAPTTVQATTGGNVLDIALGDVNADSKPDIVSASSLVGVFLQRSSQSLSITSANATTAGATMTITVDRSVSGGAGGNLMYSVTSTTNAAVLDQGNNQIVIGAHIGTATITVSTPGDADYASASAAPQVITIDKGTPTLMITSGSILVNESTTVTVATTAADGQGGAFTFETSAGSGSVTIDSVTGLMQGVSPGTVTLTVTSAGDTDYFPSSVSQQMIVLPQPPRITSFTPQNGPIGTAVTISGSNFDSTPANNIVFFGATQATVTGGSDTMLAVNVPLGANYHYITVTNLNTKVTAYAAGPFIVTYPNNGAIDLAPKVDIATIPMNNLQKIAHALGDLDHDGLIDIVLPNLDNNTVTIYRNTSSVGNFNFTAVATFPTDQNPFGAAIGDVDGDGQPDFVVAAFGGTGTVSVFKNMTASVGSMSFTNALVMNVSGNPSSVAIQDLDGDGRPDLVTTSGSSNMVSFFHNASISGVISFDAQQTMDSGLGFTSAIGDLDGDGKPDLAVAAVSGNAVAVYRNLSVAGGISFTPFMLLSTDAIDAPVSVAMGDLDLDGKIDITVAAFFGSTVSFFRNTSTPGNLSFAARQDIPMGSYANTSALGDLDGDGKPDLVVASEPNNMLSVLHNTSTSGAITFSDRRDYVTGVGPIEALLGDMDGDGKLDIITANTNILSLLRNVGSDVPRAQTLTITSANTVNVDENLAVSVTTTAADGGGILSYYIANGSGSAFIDETGIAIGAGAGTVTLVVTSSGNTNYASASVSQVITIGKGTPTLEITSSDTVDVYSSLSATVITSATYGRGGDIAFSISAGSGSATVDASSGLFTATGAGTVTLIVSSAGDSDYYSTTTTQEIIINKLTPTLTITSLDTLRVNESLTATITTTAIDGGGDLSYSILGGSGSATVDSTGLLTAIAAGTVTLTVSASGSTNYYAATVSQLITISQTTPTLTITSPNVMHVDDSLTATVTTSATGGRGGLISFAIAAGSGSATVDTGTGLIIASGAGTVTLVVTSAGDSDYSPATASEDITIYQATPTLTITSSDTMNVDESLTVTVNTTAHDGGGTLSYSMLNNTGSALVDGSGVVTGIGAGTVTLLVTSSGNTNYYPVTVSQVLTINRSTPTLTVTSPNTMMVQGTLTATVITSATYGRGGDFSFAISGGSGSATVDTDSGLITAIDAGTVTLLVTSAGDADYDGASTSQIITIGKTTPTLTITSSSQMVVGGTQTATVSTTALAAQGGAMHFAISAGSGSATVDADSGLVTAIHAGTVTLQASSVGDADYYPAMTNQLITISRSTPTLSITSASAMVVDSSLTATITSTVPNPGTLSYGIVNSAVGVAYVNTRGLVQASQHGMVTLIVNSSGTADYYPATTSQVINIGKSTPTLTITSANHLTVGSSLTATIITSATYHRGGAKSYAIVAGSGSDTVNQTTGRITAISAGTVTLIASAAGDADYYPASKSQLITINSMMMAANSPSPAVPEQKASLDEPVMDENQDATMDQQIIVPQVFSPNGDGLNDVFDIQHIQRYPNNEVVIADRKGEAVFKAHGYNNDTVVFTGKSTAGAQLLEGVYYYTIVCYNCYDLKMKRYVGYFKLKR